MVLSGIDIAIGGIASIFANRASASILGGEPPNPLLLGAVSVALLATTIAASWFPARSASRVDPQKALRQD